MLSAGQGSGTRSVKRPRHRRERRTSNALRPLSVLAHADVRAPHDPAQ
jgi:hypothetical protein